MGTSMNVRFGREGVGCEIMKTLWRNYESKIAILIVHNRYIVRNKEDSVGNIDSQIV